MTRAVSLFAPLALALALVNPGCGPKGPTTPGPVSLHSNSVEEGEAMLALDLTYTPKGNRLVELTLKMQVSGINETDKLVGEVYINGFNVEDGQTRWEGFVPPRQPQTYKVTLALAEGKDAGEATVQLSRSIDSHILLREKLAFDVDAEGMVSAKIVEE